MYNVGEKPTAILYTYINHMHSHQSYPNITTVIHSYEYSTTVDNSTIETYSTGIEPWVKGKMYTSILYNIINCHARVFKKKNQNTPRPSKHPPGKGDFQVV